MAQRSYYSKKTTNEGTFSDTSVQQQSVAVKKIPINENIDSEIHLNEQFFSAVNWGRALESLKIKGE